MKKIHLLLLLTLCFLQANAQKPSAISSKVLKKEVIGRAWSATDTATSVVQVFRITKDSVSISLLKSAYSKDFTYHFIQVKDNIFELELFNKEKSSGYLYGYISRPGKLSILLEEERQKISTGLPTGGEWKTYELQEE